MSSAIEIRNLALPDFSDSNKLFEQSQTQLDGALGNLAKALTTVKDTVYGQNQAKLLEYLNSAQSPDQLQSAEFQQGYANLRNSLGNAFNAKEVSALMPAQQDLLSKRAAETLQMEAARTGIDATQQRMGFDATNQARTELLGKRADNTNAALGFSNDPIGQLAFLATNPDVDNAALLKIQQDQAEASSMQALREAQTKAVGTGIKATEASTAGQLLQNEGLKSENSITAGEAQAFTNANPWLKQSANYGTNVANFTKVIPRIAQYDGAITTAASKYGLDPNLLRAVTGAESAGNPNAKSPVGAKGLVQIMPETRTEILKQTGIDAYSSPENNILAGAYYLSRRLKDNNGDVPKALAAYNAGQGNVNKYKGVPPFRETQDYVQRVGDLYSYLGTGQDGTTLKYPAGMGTKGKGNQPVDMFTPIAKTMWDGVSTAQAKGEIERAAAQSKLPTKTVSQWQDENTGWLGGYGKSNKFIHAANATPDFQKLTEDEKVFVLDYIKSQTVSGDSSPDNLKKLMQIAVNKRLQGNKTASNAGQVAAFQTGLRSAMAAASQAGRPLDPYTAARGLGIPEEFYPSLGVQVPQGNKVPPPASTPQVYANVAPDLLKLLNRGS